MTAATTDPETVLRVMEAFGRAAVGLGLEGINVDISVSTVDTDDAPDEVEDEPGEG